MQKIKSSIQNPYEKLNKTEKKFFTILNNILTLGKNNVYVEKPNMTNDRYTIFSYGDKTKEGEYNIRLEKKHINIFLNIFPPQNHPDMVEEEMPIDAINENDMEEVGEEEVDDEVFLDMADEEDVIYEIDDEVDEDGYYYRYNNRRRDSENRDDQILELNGFNPDLYNYFEETLEEMYLEEMFKRTKEFEKGLYKVAKIDRKLKLDVYNKFKESVKLESAMK